MSIKNPQQSKEQRRQLRRDMTKAEELFWMKVRRKQVSGVRFKRQYGIGPYILDFYVPKKNLAIEIDGGIHEIETVKQKDTNKEAFLNKNGIQVIRFTNETVLNELDRIIKEIEILMNESN